MPSLLFFKPINVQQIPYEIILYFILLQIIFFLNFLLLIKYIKNFFDKFFKIKKNELILALLLFHFLIFFYSDLRNYANKTFEFKNSVLDVILILLLYSIVLFFIFKIIKNKKVIYFLILFTFFNYTLIIYNYSISLDFSLLNNNDKKKNEFNKKNYSSDTNIYYFLFDGMMSLENAENYKIIKNKNNLYKFYNENNFEYIYNSISNYSTTNLSIHSLFEMEYILDENDIRYSYSNRELMYPHTFLNERLYPKSIILLNDLNTRFFWIGNQQATCKKTKYIYCIEYNNANLIYIIKEFYYLTPLKYLLKNIGNNSDDTKFIEDPVRYLENISKIISDKKHYKNNFLFFHILLPHPIHLENNTYYIYDQNCKIVNPSKNTYADSYNCALKTINNIIENIHRIDENDKIIIFSSDHGWNLGENQNLPYIVNNQLNIEKEKEINDRAEIFNLISSPSRCKSSAIQNSLKSPINNIKFIFNCAYNLDLAYSENVHYKSFYEKDGEIFGKVFRFKKN